MSQWRRVLVGVDVSEGSRRALAWAADEARQHRAELHVLTAWLPPVPPVGIAHGKCPVTVMR